MCTPLWPLFTRLHLTENIRAREDPHFSRFLIALGNGALQTMESELITIPNELRLAKGGVHGTFDDLLERIYPQISNACVKPKLFSERAILTPRNEDVDLINSKLIESFYRDAYCYKSFCIVIDDHCNILSDIIFKHTLPRRNEPT